MVDKANKTLGFTVMVAGVPSTLDEAVKLFGTEKDVVDIIVAQEMFHGWNGTFAKKFVDAAKKKYASIQPRVKEVIPATYEKNEDGTDKVNDKGEKIVKSKEQTVYESPLNYRKFLSSSGVSAEDLKSLADEVASSIKFGEATARAGRVGKSFYDTADVVLGLPEADRETVIGNLLALNTGVTIAKDEATGDYDRDDIAAALKEDETRSDKERLAKLGLSK